MDVFVAGGSGFVGRRLCEVLDSRGHSVTAASRSPSATSLPPTVDTVAVDIVNDPLEQALVGHDVVVNLVALPAHVQSARSHDVVHGEGTRNLVSASEAAGVRRFHQMSALGVDSDVETAYFEAKRKGEGVVRSSSLSWVIYRPSVLFGDGCRFLPFLRRLSVARVVPLPGGGRMRVQPLWIDDLVEIVAAGVSDPSRTGETYSLGGPATLTLAELVRVLRPRGIVVPIPHAIAAGLAVIAGAVPGVPLGRDQVRFQQHDNVADPNDVAAFGIETAELLSLQGYLSESHSEQY
jgi:NADH dehydrogenase